MRRLGHDVSRVPLDVRALTDQAVLALAMRDQRIVLTFDKDFGQLALASSLSPDCGVILFRVPPPKGERISTLASLLSEREDWVGHFSVVEPGRVRMRPLQ